MKVKDTKYNLFSIHLVAEIHTSIENSFNRIFASGVYNYANSIDLSGEEPAKQLLYDFKHGRLSGSLVKLFEGMQIEQAANTSTLKVDLYERSLVVNEISRNNKFKVEVMEHTKEKRLKEAADILGEAFNISNPAEVMEKYKTSDPEGSPMAVMTPKVWNKYYGKKVTEFERMQLAFYLAIGSIIGLRKPYAQTNKALILARSFGYNTMSDLKADGFESNPLYLKYSKRKQFRRVIDKLQRDWGVLYYADRGRRSLIVGMKSKISLEYMIRAYKQSSTKYKDQLRRTKEREISKKIELELFGGDKRAV